MEIHFFKIIFSLVGLVFHQQCICSNHSEALPPLQSPPLVSQPIPPKVPTHFQCKSKLSCRDRCVKPQQVGYQKKVSCYCDPCCEMFLDCCADYSDYCDTNSDNIKTVFNKCTGGLNKSIVSESNRDLWKPYKNHAFRKSAGIWMIGSCPKSWPNDDTFYQCRNLSAANTITKDNYQYLPVYTSDGTVYHNRFCAQCNGESLHELKMYLLRIECNALAPSNLNAHDKMAFLIEYCSKENIKWELLKDAPRRYSYCMELPCQKNNNPDCKDCYNTSPGLVHFNERLYKNVYCVKCDFGLHFDLSDVTCGPYGDVCSPISTIPVVKPFSVIFDFNPDSSIKSEKVVRECPLGEAYDNYLDTCRSMLSLQGPPKLSNDDSYEVVLWVKCYSECSSTFFKKADFNKEIAQNFRISTRQIKILKIISDGIPELHFQITVKQNESIVTQTITRGVFNFISPFNITIGNKLLLIFKATTRKLTCTDMETYYRDQYIIGNKSVVIISTGEVLTTNQYYTNGTISESSTVIFVCRKHQYIRNTCLKNWVLMKEGEYHLFGNGTLLVNASKQTYDVFQYLWNNQSLYICENFTSFKIVIHSSRKTTTAKSDVYLSMMTLVGMSISIAALVLVLATYSLFTELRTTPGINLMNLSASILLAQLLWLVGSGQTDKPMACTAIAVLLHYFFLVSFVWTSIIAFDTWRAFTCKGRRSQNNSKSKSLWYMAIGWFSVIMYVGICVLLDFTKVTDIGYKSAKACWISNPSAILYFFAIPVAVILLFNLILYTLTIRAIHVTKSQSSFAAADKDRKKSFGIYVRIASAMGFTWVTGFIAPFGWDFLWFAFVFFNTLQGVYIAVAFVFNERVMKLYNQLFIGNVISTANHLSSQTRSNGIKNESMDATL